MIGQSAATGPDAADRDMIAALRRAGLIESKDAVRLVPLTGGVASDIHKVEAGGRVFCVKRALPKLRVAQDWFVPTERNANEAAWIEIANQVELGAAPALLAHVPEAGLFAMAYLAPHDHPVWMVQLHAGDAEPRLAALIGRRLGRIHAATADDAALAARFASDAIFHAIRLEAYLKAAARANADVAEPILAAAHGPIRLRRHC